MKTQNGFFAYVRKCLRSSAASRRMRKVKNLASDSRITPDDVQGMRDRLREMQVEIASMRDEARRLAVERYLVKLAMEGTYLAQPVRCERADRIEALIESKAMQHCRELSIPTRVFARKKKEDV